MCQEIWVGVFSEINIRPRSWKKITLALQECRIWVFYVINIRLWLERFSILCVNKLGLESSNRELCPNDSNYAICRPLGDWYQTQSVKSSILLKQRPHVLQLFVAFLRLCSQAWCAICRTVIDIARKQSLPNSFCTPFVATGMVEKRPQEKVD